MTPVYQTRLESIARLLIDQGFKATKKNNIWEFEYTQELGEVLNDMRSKKDELTSI